MNLLEHYIKKVMKVTEVKTQQGIDIVEWEQVKAQGYFMA